MQRKVQDQGRFTQKIIQVHFVNQPKSTDNRLRAFTHVLNNFNTTISPNPENVHPVIIDDKKRETFIAEPNSESLDEDMTSLSIKY